MASNLLEIPVEIRLTIYSLLFGKGKTVLDAVCHGGPSSLMPKHGTPANLTTRSSQLLRACRAILFEARPVLYANTTFHVMTSTFSGSLPGSLTDGSLMASYTRNLVWQLDCDMLKKVPTEDILIARDDLEMLDNIELRCRSLNWTGSFCGVYSQRSGFTEGRKQVLEYGKVLLEKMREAGHPVVLIEDRKFLGKGEVRLRFTRSKKLLGPEEQLLEDFER